jgi:hypothetical protein
VSAEPTQDATSSAVQTDAGMAPPSPARPQRPPAPETQRLYAGGWAAFESWCRQAGVPALPATAVSVESFLASLTNQLRPGSLRRRLAAIAERHRRAGHTPPDDAAVRRVLRTARAAAPAQPRTAIIGPVQLTRLAIACPGDRAGLRDRALLLLLAANRPSRTGHQRQDGTKPAEISPEDGSGDDSAAPAGNVKLAQAALLALQVEQVRFTSEGMEIVLPNEPDGVNPVQHLAFRRSTHFTTCPVHALEDWLRASACRYGPVFRKVDRWGNVEHRALNPTALRQILIRRGVGGPRSRTRPPKGGA